MGRIVMFNHVTADGYFAAADGAVDWMVPEDELDRAVAEHMPDSGTLLLGRRTYELFAAYWPHALDDPQTAPDPHDPERRSAEIRTMAVWLNEATKLVVSRTLEAVTWRNSHLLRELDPREIEALKRERGEDILIFGSGSIVSQLTQHGLIDEYRFVVNPLLLGSGRPLISDVSRHLRLELLESRAFPSGVVLMRYARAER